MAVLRTLALLATLGGCATWGTRGLRLAVGPTVDDDGEVGGELLIEATRGSRTVFWSEDFHPDAAYGVDRAGGFTTATLGLGRAGGEQEKVLTLVHDWTKLPYTIGLGLGGRGADLEDDLDLAAELRAAFEWPIVLAPAPDGHAVAVGGELRCAYLPGAARARCGAHATVLWLEFFAEGSGKH